MKINASSKSAFLNSRALLISGVFVAAAFVAMPKYGVFPSAEARSPNTARSITTPTPCAVFAYVSNLGSNNISVIDTSTNTVVATIPALGSSPNGVSVNPAGTRAYITNGFGNSGSVSVIDTFHNWVFDVITNGIGSDPMGLAVTPDGSHVYVANTSNGASTLSIIDTSNNTVVGTVGGLFYPYGVAVKPDGTRVYSSSMNVPSVAVIDTSTNTVIGHVGVPGFSNGIAVTPDGTRVYVTTHNASNSYLCAIDTSSNTVAGTIWVDSYPNAVAINPAGTRAYVTLSSNTVAVIDTSINRILTTVAVGSSPQGVSVTPDGSRVYVANYSGNTVSVIDASNNTVIATVPVGMYPTAFGNFIAAVPCPSPTPTPTPTPPPHPCQLRVLLIYADYNAPADFQWEIQNEPNVARVDLFNGRTGTPTLAQLQQYDIIVPLSFRGLAFQDANLLGNNLADYVDAGGVIVQYGETFPSNTISGRWISGGYNPYYFLGSDIFDLPITLGMFNPAHPLMAGVGSLNTIFADVVGALGGIEVAQMITEFYNGSSLVAFRPVSSGHTTVGVAGYVGDYAYTHSGDWAKVVVNAGNWLYNCEPGGPTPSPTPTCEWQVATPLPVDEYGAAGASDGTYFYAAGGYSWTQGTLNSLYRWSPNPVPNGSWTTLAPMPQAASVATGVYYPLTNKIYVFGGFGVTGANLNLTQIYDIASNTWSLGAPMPDVRDLSAGGYISATARIYIISGDSTGYVQSAQPNTWAYDPVVDSWADLTDDAPFPHPAGGFAYGVINNKLYIVGGRDGNNQLTNLTWEYDPITNAYTQKADEPASFQNNVPGSAVAGGLLWVFGGGNPFNGTGGSYSALASAKATHNTTKSGVPWSGGNSNNQAFPTTADTGRSYDPATDTWALAPSLVVARSFPSGGAIGDQLLVAAGGYNGYTSVHTVQKKTVCIGIPTLTGAVSRKAHGAAGSFDVNLPLTGTPGIECRAGGATNDYTMVATFSGNVTVTGNPQAEVTSGNGCVGTGGGCTGNVNVSGNTVTVPLTNIANAQMINVRINGVNNGVASDAPAADFTIPMNILIGDTNGNGTVNASDVSQTKSRLGQSVDGTNFRSDVNANGALNSGDVSIVKANLGTGLR